jgi:hypothetical protein
MNAPYAAIANIETWRHTDAAGVAISFRVAGSRRSVDAELGRITALCSERAWLRTMGPYRWGDEWVAHGVLRERKGDR